MILMFDAFPRTIRTEWLYQASEKPVRKYDLEKIIESFQK